MAGGHLHWVTLLRPQFLKLSAKGSGAQAALQVCRLHYSGSTFYLTTMVSYRCHRWGNPINQVQVVCLVSSVSRRCDVGLPGDHRLGQGQRGWWKSEKRLTGRNRNEQDQKSSIDEAREPRGWEHPSCMSVELLARALTALLLCAAGYACTYIRLLAIADDIQTTPVSQQYHRIMSVTYRMAKNRDSQSFTRIKRLEICTPPQH